MMDVALSAEGTEIALQGYSRQTVTKTQLEGGVVIFPRLGTPNMWHKIDSVIIFYPTKTNILLKVLPIIAPGGPTASAFSHQGDNDLRIRFSCPYPYTRTEVTATERTEEDVDAMRELFNMINSVEVGL
jgi:hypothetical protein